MATDNKYDRQLRLWGGSGQKALMEANILLVNASATGTETLKNLVLPGEVILPTNEREGNVRDLLPQPFRPCDAFNEEEDQHSRLI